KHLRHLLPAKHGWVHPIRAEILARPNQSILAALDAVSPHVRSPHHPWEPYSAARRIVIIFRETRNLVGDDPLRSEAALIRVGLGILRHGGVTGIDAAGQISDCQIGEPL